MRREDLESAPQKKPSILHQQGDSMKTRSIGLVLVTLFVGLTLCYGADNPNMGTWKLNESKSKFPAGATKNTTVVYEAAGDNVKVTVDGVDAKGAPAHNEWTGKFDGKDYPTTGDPTYDMRSYKQVNDHTLAMTMKKDGKAVGTGRITVSADGKTRTVKTEMADASGKKVNVTAVYDKQ
jgi:hypothetical protein